MARMTQAEFVRKREAELVQEEENYLAQRKLERVRHRDRIFSEDSQHTVFNDFHKRTQQVHEDYINFRNSLKDSLINEAICSIYIKAIPTTVKEMCTDKGIVLEDVCKGFVHDIVNENGGYDRIYNKMKRNGLFDDYVGLIEYTYKNVLEAVDKDHPETYGMPTNIKNGFYTDLSQATPDEVIEVIKGRVTDSIDSFIDDNKKMKRAVTDIYNDAQTKIATTNDDTMKEHYQVQAKRAIKLVEESKPMNVYGRLLSLMTEEILMDEELFPQFINEETQRIDHEKCMGTTGVMYTLLETMNTLKLIDVNKQYVDEMLEEMGKRVHKKKIKKKAKESKDKKKLSDELDIGNEGSLVSI